MAQTRIFISHSHHDNEWCRAFAATLTAIGYDVWLDEAGLQGGDAWVASIQREVQTRDVFIPILTPESWASEWVQKEVHLAIATGRRIIQVMLRDVQVGGFLLTDQQVKVIGEEPQVAARAVIKAIETPPAPNRSAAPQASTETLDDLIVLCRSLAAEKRYTEALSACNRTLALDPKNVGVLKIKAEVLHAVGDTRLEGRTWFELLLADPDRGSGELLLAAPLVGSFARQSSIVDHRTVMWESLTEEEVVQAYSLLRPRSRDSYGQHTSLANEMLTALERLNRLDVAVDVMAQISDEQFRNVVLSHFPHGGMKPEVFVWLVERWYGFPPRLNSMSGIYKLDYYAQAIANVGRASDARTVRELIVRVFEGSYGDVCKRLWLPHTPPWGYSNSGQYVIYLASLDAIGRARDAERLRKAYGDGSRTND